MIEDIIKAVKDFIREEAEDFYNHEDNFNNADITSRQRIYTNVADIEDGILRGVKWRKELERTRM